MKFNLRIYMVVLFMLLMFTFNNSTAQWENKGKFPILAWYGPRLDIAGINAFEQMKEAGFTLCYSPLKDNLSNLRLLHIADSLKFGVLLGDNRIDAFLTSQDTLMNLTDQIVADYQNFPSLWGYLLDDKPGFADFEKLAKIKTQIQERDPSRTVFVNLLPIYSTPIQLGLPNYFNYIWKFIDFTNPDLLCFEHFPVTRNGLRTDYYKNLEIVRKAALDKNIPFWTSILSVPHLSYPETEHSHLRVQIYSALAYGVKGLAYFTYMTPESQLWNYDFALLDKDGNPTRTYEYASVINKEVHRLAPTLEFLTSTGVYHSDPLPAGCSLPEPGLPIIRVEGESIMMGFFKHKRAKYVLLVNKNYIFGAKPRIYFSQNVKKIKEISKNNLDPYVVNFKSSETEKSCNILFKAGDGRLFRIYD